MALASLPVRVAATVVGALLGFAATLHASPAPTEVRDLEVTRGGIWQVGSTYIAGQPTEATLKALAERGVTGVISLRTAREMSDASNVPFDEPAVVRSLGMDYLNIGLGGYGTYSPDSLRRIHEFMEKHRGQVLMHCTVGGRATVAWTSLMTRYHNVPLQDALEQGYEMGLWPQSIEQMLGEKIEWRLTGETLPTEKGWLVDAAWLTEHGADRSVRLVDVRPAYTKYLEGHATGATHFDPHALRGPREGVPAQFRTNDDMAAILGKAGISTSQRIVVYAEGDDILNATMTMFALEKLGHLNSSLLDGGVGSVRETGLVTQAYPAMKEESFPPFTNKFCSAALEDIEQGMGSGGVLFVDARPPEQYEGTTNGWQRNGHIPGAVNVFWKRLTAEADASPLAGRDEVRSIFESAGVTPDKDIVVYCGTGREATLLYMTLTRELGYPRVRLYEGGWTEYAAKDHLPVAN